MQTLKMIVADIYNPVIQEVDTMRDNNDICLEISKLIENLHSKKITEILTLHYIIKECASKINNK